MVGGELWVPMLTKGGRAGREKRRAGLRGGRGGGAWCNRLVLWDLGVVGGVWGHCDGVLLTKGSGGFNPRSATTHGEGCRSMKWRPEGKV